MSSWYLVLTKPREENRATLNLKTRGITAYFPRVEVSRLQRGKPKQLIEPLFPRYLFVQLTDDAGFSSVRYTPGICDFVRFAQRFAKVSDSLIASLKQHESHQQKMISLPDIGDKVTITQGSFRGVEAIIHARKGEDRILLLLELLNQQAELEMGYHQIETS